jgi:hypothetical protein
VNGTYYQIDAPNSTGTTISGVGPSGLIFGYYGDSQGSYGYVGTCPKKDICTQKARTRLECRLANGKG